MISKIPLNRNKIKSTKADTLSVIYNDEVSIFAFENNILYHFGRKIDGYYWKDCSIEFSDKLQFNRSNFEECFEDMFGYHKDFVDTIYKECLTYFNKKEIYSVLSSKSTATS